MTPILELRKGTEKNAMNDSQDNRMGSKEWYSLSKNIGMMIMMWEAGGKDNVLFSNALQHNTAGLQTEKAK